MRRFRAFWGVGLALSLSGCAGINQCFLSKPCLTSKLTAGGAKLKKPCFLSKRRHCKRCGTSMPMATPQSMSTPQSSVALPCPCGHFASSAVPIPPPDRVTSYFPAFNPRGTPGVMESNRPDPLGVRSSVSRPGPVEGASARKGPSEAVAAPTTAKGGMKTEAVPTAVPDAPSEAAPGPRPTPTTPPPLTPIEPSRPRAAAFRLESGRAAPRAGRPERTRSEPVPRPRPGERTDAVGDLVFPASYYAVDPSPRLIPVPREIAASEPPRRTSILSRLVRRIRGTASPGDAEPGSARREAHDVAQGRQAVRRASADRLDEPSQR